MKNFTELPKKELLKVEGGYGGSSVGGSAGSWYGAGNTGGYGYAYAKTFGDQPGYTSKRIFSYDTPSGTGRFVRASARTY